MQILHTLPAPFHARFPAPQQETAAEHGPQNGAQSRGTLASPGAGEEGAAMLQYSPTWAASYRTSTTG